MEEKNSSHKKTKMVFAKDKNEIILMVIVLIAFIITTAYSIVNVVKENSPVPHNSRQAMENPANPKPMVPSFPDAKEASDNTKK